MNDLIPLLYRLPGEKRYVRIRPARKSPEVLHDYKALGGKKGFVLAPFTLDQGIPILLFPMNDASYCHVPQSEHTTSGIYQPVNPTAEQQSYAQTFARFRQPLADNQFGKIVLSRTSDYAVIHPDSPEQLFFQACRRYPNAFVALVPTYNHGTWLISTPELLLSINSAQGKTMALAGTIPASTKTTWNEKNKEEHQIVVQYIRQVLTPFTTQIYVSQPKSVHAGNVIHLQTDFQFQLRPNADIPMLIEKLHPTPAVCGMPKEETKNFIIQNEPTPRHYYSGFAGPIDHQGTTNLYVSLRCMQITDRHLRLYAGGGLLKESVMNEEWQETENKMGTMRALFLQSAQSQPL